MQEPTRTYQEVRFNVVILILGALTAFGSLSIDMYLPSFPAIAKDMATSLASVQLSLASFFIGLAFGQIFYGPITDRYGRKKPLYVGLAIYTVASLVCAFTKSVEMLILFRFIQALGACSGLVIARAMVRDLFSQQDTAKVFSLLMLIMGVAPIVAPLVGGYVSAFLGWRAIFVLLALFSTLCLLAVIFILPETHRPDGRVRIQDSVKIYGRILRDRHYMGYALAAASAQAGMFAYVTGSSFVFIDLYGVSAENFGWIFGANALGLIFFSQVNGRLLLRFGYEQILRKSLIAIAVFSVMLGLSGLLGGGFWAIMIPLFLSIATMGMVSPNSSAGAMATQKQSAGSGSALLGTLQFTAAASASGLVSKLHNGTVMPMVGIMAFCGVLSLVIHRVMIVKNSEKQA
jgi:DHA1 family bicyclomycin/chloramphenicol resistance-like MFS transporter